MISYIKTLLINNGFKDILNSSISQKAIKLLLIQSFGLIITFISNFWIAKLLNSSGYGQYTFYITIINLLSTFACLGFSSLLIREIPSNQIKNNYSEIKGLIKFTFLISLGCSIILSTLFIISSYLNLLPHKANSITLLSIGIAIPASTLLLIRQYILQGLNKPIESQIINNFIKYLLVILLLIVAFKLYSITINATNSILIYSIALIVCYLSIELIFIKNKPQQIKNIQEILYSEVWLKTTFVLLFYKVVMSILTSSEIFFLSYLRNDDEVGIYTVARKTSGFVSFGLTAANVVLAPKIATLFAEGRLEVLQSFLRKSMSILFVLSIIISTLIISFSIPVFSLLGKEYIQSFSPLVIMITGELINVAFGPVANILVYSKQEKNANTIIFFTLLFNITCNIFLTSKFGYIGAAITTMLSTLCWNGLMALQVKRKTGIKCWIW